MFPLRCIILKKDKLIVIHHYLKNTVHIHTYIYIYIYICMYVVLDVIIEINFCLSILLKYIYIY